VILLAGDELVLVLDTLEVFAKFKDPTCVLRHSHGDEFMSRPIV